MNHALPLVFSRSSLLRLTPLRARLPAQSGDEKSKALQAAAAASEAQVLSLRERVACLEVGPGNGASDAWQSLPRAFRSASSARVHA